MVWRTRPLTWHPSFPAPCQASVSSAFKFQASSCGLHCDLVSLVSSQVQTAGAGGHRVFASWIAKLCEGWVLWYKSRCRCSILINSVGFLIWVLVFQYQTRPVKVRFARNVKQRWKHAQKKARTWKTRSQYLYLYASICIMKQNEPMLLRSGPEYVNVCAWCQLLSVISLLMWPHFPWHIREQPSDMPVTCNLSNFYTCIICLKVGVSDMPKPG